MQLLVAKPVVGRTVEPMDGRENDEEGDGKTYNNNNYYYKSTNDLNQTTQDFKTLCPGQGCLTVVVTATARTIDLALATVTDDGVLMLGSPAMGDRLMAWFDRYIFPMDRVTLSDCTDTTATFTVLGAQGQAVLEQLGFRDLASLAPYAHQSLMWEGQEIRAIADSGLARPGYTLWVDAAGAAPLWQYLIESGAIPAGEQCWETWRIEDGVPKPGCELTDDFNPLEAGLWHAVSIDKGCYIGQETIARLNTYDGVKQFLYGVKLTQFLEPGTKLRTPDGNRAGVVTSCLPTEEGALGLAYIRRKQCEVGTALVGDRPEHEAPAVILPEGTILDIPFPVRSNPTAANP